jgi:hypothetical protein
VDFALRPGDAMSNVWWRISTASGLDVDRRKNISRTKQLNIGGIRHKFGKQKSSTFSAVDSLISIPINPLWPFLSSISVCTDGTFEELTQQS